MVSSMAGEHMRPYNGDPMTLGRDFAHAITVEHEQLANSTGRMPELFSI
jgi:hypothetical protein